MRAEFACLNPPVPEPGGSANTRSALAEGSSGADPLGPLRDLVETLVASAFEIDHSLLRHPTRGRKRIALARQAAMYLAHVACELSLTEVGALFGRDRTTVAHACQVIEQRREDAHFDAAVDLLETSLRLFADAHAPHESLRRLVAGLDGGAL